MTNLSAIARLIEGRSAFTLIDVDGRPHQGPWSDGLADFRGYAGQPVLWPLKNEPGAIVALLQALAAGVIPVILPADQPAAKLAMLREQFPLFGLSLPDAWIAPRCHVSEPEAVLFCLLTSGSTGHPKVIAASDTNVARGVAAIHRAQGLEACQGTAVTLPLAYSYAFVNQLLWALVYEKTLLLTRGLTLPADTLKLIAQQPVDMLCLVAQQMKNLQLAHADPSLECSRIRVINFAGSSFPGHGISGLKGLFPNASVNNNYGCTEAMPRLTVRRMRDDFDDIRDVGQPIGDIELRIVDAEGQPVDSANCGAIQFRGSSASTGTLSSSGRFEPHGPWIGSGDQGFLNQGRLHILGRHDQVIKAGAERFSLLEIEQALLKQDLDHAFIHKAADLPDDSLVAVVAGPEKPILKTIMKQLRLQLPPGAIPKKIFWIDQWPVLANHKTDRERLKQLIVERSLEQL